MPELPEVEIVRRALEPVFAGRRIESLIFNRRNLRFDLPQTLPERISFSSVSSVSRRGKYLTVFTENGCGFVLHLGMSGVIRIEAPDDKTVTKKHDHVEFHLSAGYRVVFNDPRRFGFLEELDEKNWEDYGAFSSMGPEPLGNDFSGPVLFERLRGRTSPVKNALLDQKVVAGLGNIYVCEALYYAGIDPVRSACDITARECDNMARAIKSVLRKALDAGGSSLRDYKHTDGQLGYFQHQFSVYDREGEVCRDCTFEGPEVCCVKRIVQSGRSTFYCPERQV